jgi:anti-sigma factor RsiW
MKCWKREQLFAYVHRMLEPREESAVRSHLDECARCREVAEEFRELDTVLDAWQPVEPSPWFDARVRAAVAAAEQKRSASPLFGLRWARWLAPALLVVLVVLGFLWVRRSPEVSKPVAQRVAPRTIQPAPAVTAETPHQPLARTQAPSVVRPPAAGATEEDEISLYDNLPILEDYDLLANFDVLSELPRGGKKVVN